MCSTKASIPVRRAARRIRRSRRERGAAMLEAAMVALVMVGLLATTAMVGKSLTTKLQAAYTSRHLAFKRASQGCVDTHGTFSISMNDVGQKPSGEPEAERLEAALGDGLQVSSGVMDVAEASVQITTYGRTFGARSIVGCVERNQGEVFQISDDPSAIQNQILSALPYVWGLVEAWLF